MQPETGKHKPNTSPKHKPKKSNQVLQRFEIKSNNLKLNGLFIFFIQRKPGDFNSNSSFLFEQKILEIEQKILEIFYQKWPFLQYT